MYEIYIADCDVNGGVYHYLLQENGSTELLQEFLCDKPMYLAKRNGKFYIELRAPFSGESSGIFVYDMEHDSKISKQKEVFSTHGICGCHLCVAQNGDVYAANYLSGSVSKMPNTVHTNLGPVGPTQPRQDKPHMHYVGLSKDEKYLLAVDLGQDTITVFDRDLKEVSVAHAPAGVGPRHLIFSENGNTLYCVNELASSVSSYQYEDGKLTLAETVSILPKEFNGTNTAAAIRVKGNYLYVSNRGHNSIAVLKAEGTKLELLNITSCEGQGPRDFDIFGNTLVCTNEDSGTVTFFKVDGEKLTKLPNELKLKRPLCVIGNEVDL